MDAGIAAIICAAGSSKRFRESARFSGSVSADGSKKEYCVLPSQFDETGKTLTVLGAAVSAFASCPKVGPIVVTVPADSEKAEDEAAGCLPARLLDEGRVFFVPGGKSRRESVHKALLFLKEKGAVQEEELTTEFHGGNKRVPNKTPYYSVTSVVNSYLSDTPVNYVLIHDGARPWVSSALIERVIEAMLRHKAAIPVIPALETPKLCGDSGFVEKHLRRENIGFAQTPQGFAFAEILSAHEKARLREEKENYEYTDDAEVWGEFAGPVAVVSGETENQKITFKGDLSS